MIQLTARCTASSWPQRSDQDEVLGTFRQVEHPDPHCERSLAYHRDLFFQGESAHGGSCGLGLGLGEADEFSNLGSEFCFCIHGLSG